MTPAIRLLDAEDVAYTVYEYEHAGDLRDFGAEAARELGLDPDQVFKTLLVTADSSPAVAIVPVSRRLAVKAMARALGAKRVDLCDRAFAERITGYVVGGISPFGQKRRLTTVLDESAMTFDRIFVSGGKRGLDIAIDPNDVVRVLGARTADITDTTHTTAAT